MSRQSSVVRNIIAKCDIEASQLEDAYPCTSLQAGLLAASIQETADYTSRFVFQLTSSSYDPSQVKAAVEAVFETTPILRTRFVEQKGIFLQVVVREHLVWISGDSLDEYIENDKRCAITLGKPVARFGWITDSNGQVYMIWTLHHAQYDEWSLDLLFAQVSQHARIEAVKSDNQTSVSFKKFVKAIQSVDKDASRQFWSHQLPESIATRRNWSDSGSRHAVTNQYVTKSVDFSVPDDCEHRPALLAAFAWSVINSKLTESQNVLFGNIVNGRTMNMLGIEGVVGPTLTTVPWNLQLPPKSTISEFLDDMAKAQAEILPFEQTGLAEYLRIGGSAGFDTLLLVQNTQDQPSEEGVPVLRPDDKKGSSPSHACCVLFDVHFHSTTCEVKASYDDVMLDESAMIEIIDLFSSVMRHIILMSNTTIGTLLDSLKFTNIPKSISHPEPNPNNETREADSTEHSSDVDTELFDKVIRLISKASGLEDSDKITADTSLMELGIDSVRTVTVTRKLSEAFKVVIPFKGIAGGKRTVLEVAHCVQAACSGTTDAKTSNALSLIDEAKKHERVLDSVVQAKEKIISASNGGSLLLTGANGYLGIEILRQCLKKHNGRIIALVRCSDPASGLLRLEAAAKLARWTTSELSGLSRVDVWSVDLTKPNLGLSAEYWKALNDPDASLELQAIIQNAARVDFLPTYKDLEQVNVVSTSDLLSTALRRTDCSNFVYVTGGRPTPTTDNNDISATSRVLANAPGYSQSKFVGELLVRKAAALMQEDSLARSTIVHPGLIMGSGETGVANSNDFVWRYVAASILMGCYVVAVPVKREWINIDSVDSVALIIVNSALTRDGAASKPETHNIRFGLPLSDFWSIVLSQLGDIEMEEVSEQEWLGELEDSIEEHEESHPLFGLSEMIFGGGLKGIGSATPQNLPSCQKSEVLAEALRSNVRYLKSMGYFSLDGNSDPEAMFKRSSH